MTNPPEEYFKAEFIELRERINKSGSIFLQLILRERGTDTLRFYSFSPKGIDYIYFALKPYLEQTQLDHLNGRSWATTSMVDKCEWLKQIAAYQITLNIKAVPYERKEPHAEFGTIMYVFRIEACNDKH